MLRETINKQTKWINKFWSASWGSKIPKKQEGNKGNGYPIFSYWNVRVSSSFQQKSDIGRQKGDSLHLETKW